MDIKEIVNRLAEIKIKIEQLQRDEASLLASIKFIEPFNKRPRINRMSVAVRKRLSQGQKNAWANYTAKQKKERIAKSLAARKRAKNGLK